MTKIALAAFAATAVFLTVPAMAAPVSTVDKPIVVAQVEVHVGGDRDRDRHREFHRYHREREVFVARPHREHDVVVIRRHRHDD